MKEEVLDRLPSKDLRVYIVWLPILDEDGDTRVAALESAAAVPDDRARHYWDPEMALSNSLGKALAIPPRRDSAAAAGPAWDVYLAYPRGASWSSAPPPTFWMHQLTGLPDKLAPRLDGAALRAHIEGLLAPPGPPR